MILGSIFLVTAPDTIETAATVIRCTFDIATDAVETTITVNVLNAPRATAPVKAAVPIMVLRIFLPVTAATTATAANGRTTERVIVPVATTVAANITCLNLMVDNDTAATVVAAKERVMLRIRLP